VFIISSSSSPHIPHRSVTFTNTLIHRTNGIAKGVTGSLGMCDSQVLLVDCKVVASIMGLGK